MRRFIIAAACFVLVAATAVFAQNAPRMAVATLINPQGEKVGVVTFSEGDGGVTVVAQVHGLAPGLHGFHIHATGKCDPPDFKSAGGHFNPFGAEHGLQNPKGHHVGDMPNMLVGPDGTGVARALLPRATLGSGPGSLFKPGGTAVMIHSGPDDYVSDPAGNAGHRVACGVIEPLR